MDDSVVLGSQGQALFAPLTLRVRGRPLHHCVGWPSGVLAVQSVFVGQPQHRACTRAAAQLSLWSERGYQAQQPSQTGRTAQQEV